ncbi:MAG: PTS glucose transporter subunit IIA [Longicatena sp.]
MKLFKKKEKYIKSYATGTVISITKVPDEVFSKKMMGDGIAIYPKDNKILSPCEGIVTAIIPTSQHAVGITLDNGLELLIHVGLDTVNIKQKIFTTLVQIDDCVSCGQTLIEFEKDDLQKEGFSDITMCVVTSKGNSKGFEIMPVTEAVANETIIMRYQ